MKFLGFFLMCLLVNQINGMAYRRCGTQLSEIMWMICENGFNTMPTKRADPSVSAMDPMAFAFNSNSLADIFEMDEESLASKNRRARMLGIVDECCKNACTYTQLKSYCKPN